MTKKFLSFFMAFVVISAIYPNFIYADDIVQVFNVSMQNNIISGYVNTTSIKMKVTAIQNSGEEKTYRININYQDNTYSEELTTQSGVTANSIIDLEVKQGYCDIETVIYCGDAEVYRDKEEKFMAIRPYEPQFMEEISKKGINGAEKSNMNYFNLMGLQTARIGYEWGWTEKQPGIYDWPSIHQDIIDAGAEPVFLACYGNSLYNGGKADKTGPTTKEEIDLFAKYVVSAAKRYPSIKYYEIWNEPNISFWQPVPNVYDYVNLLEVTSNELKKINDDIVVIGGAMASSDFEYAGEIFNLNGAPSMDAFSVHPYCYPANSEIYIEDQMDGFEQKILEHGAWQIKVSTEFGWPTHVGDGRGVSVEKQARELVKHFAIADYNEYEINQIYRMDDLAINGEHDNSYNEDNFGVVYYDKTPKPAVLSIKTMTEMTNGSLPFGILEAPYGVSAYLYIKDKEVLAMIWRNERTNGATPSELTFEEQVSVYDMNGNLISVGNSVPVTVQPVYVKGISPDTAARSLGYTLTNKFNKKLSLIDSFKNIEGYDEMKILLDKGVQMLTFAQMPEEQEAEQKLIDYYNQILGGMINLYETGVFKGNAEQLASFLYIAHLGGIRMMPLYMLSAEPKSSDEEFNTAKIAMKDTKHILEDKAQDGTLPNSERIYKYASQMFENLEMIYNSDMENPMKDGMKKGWSTVIKLICNTAVRVASLEPVTHDNILVQIPSSEYDFTVGTEKDAKVSFYNYKDEHVIIGTSGENLVKSRGSALVPFSFLLRDKPKSFKSLKIINERL